MHWFWWVVIGLAAMFVLGHLCEDRPGVRNVICCLIALAFPIMAIINIESEGFGFVGWTIVGAIVWAYYKFVYDFAESVEDRDFHGDIVLQAIANFDALSWIYGGAELGPVVAVIVSIVIALICAAIPVALVFVFAEVSVVLSCIMLFLPFVYSIICTIIYFREEY